MIAKTFEKIELQDLEFLASNGIPESRTLDYKETLPTNEDGSKKDFLEDVVSLANAAGGDLCFGLKELRDANGKPTGTTEIVGLPKDLNEDAEKLRLEAIIRDGIKPRIPSVQIKFISGHKLGKLGVIRIHQSWVPPHMVTYKMRPAFFSRNSAGKFPLDVDEIRSSFELSMTVSENIKNFRTDRIGKILANQCPVTLPEGPKVVLHIVPIGAFRSREVYDFSFLASEPGLALPMCTRSGWDRRLNFDGYVATVDSFGTPSRSYLQIHRDAKIEAVCCNLINIGNDGTRGLYFVSVESQLIESLKSFLTLYKKIEINPPFFIMLSFLNVRGFELASGRMNLHSGDGYKIDRDHLIISELMIDDLETDSDVILRPAFDALWNACGYGRCESYDEKSGRWKDLSQRT